MSSATPKDFSKAPPPNTITLRGEGRPSVSEFGEDTNIQCKPPTVCQELLSSCEKRWIKLTVFMEFTNRGKQAGKTRE